METEEDCEISKPIFEKKHQCTDSSVQFSTEKGHQLLNPNLNGEGNQPPPIPPSALLVFLDNSETVIAVTLAFCNIQLISLETFVPNLVSVTYSSLHILGITQTGVFPIFRFLVNPL